MARLESILLIIDDNPADIDVLVEMLSPHHTVRVALNGKQGLEKARIEPKPDLVLLDVVMSEMDGYEVCKILKSDDLTRSIPAIFITVQDNPEDELHGLACGAVDYIKKPFSPAIVKARVRTHLALAEAMGALEEKNRNLEHAVRIKELVEEINRHDMKGPLTVLTQFPALIRRKHNLDLSLLEGLDIIEHAALRVLEMVNHTQNLHRIETGVYNLVPERVQLLPIFDVIQRECSSMIQGKSLRVIILPDGGIPLEEQTSVLGEALLCYCVFSNLVRNALQAAPQGSSVLITLETRDHLRRITIHNDGEIPKEIQERFFMKYATYGKLRGLGLGTYSARLMTQTMNGEIFMETSQSEGTTLTVELPISPSGLESRPTLDNPFAIYAARIHE